MKDEYETRLRRILCVFPAAETLLLTVWGFFTLDKNALAIHISSAQSECRAICVFAALFIAMTLIEYFRSAFFVFRETLRMLAGCIFILILLMMLNTKQNAAAVAVMTAETISLFAPFVFYFLVPSTSIGGRKKKDIRRLMESAGESDRRFPD
ncbi:MAG TPA: hypothetical protein DCZ71_02935 [Ruminococcus sp.]|nr:hypothetical protein [Ruminococcus sp.]